MSGFEIVGVILGSIPLLISGFEHYKDGLVPIKDMIQYEYVVKNHIRALNVTQSRLRNTCEKLLNGIVEDEELATLMNSTSQSFDVNLWKRPDLEEKLKSRLDESYDPYMATVVYLIQTIGIFAKKMGLDSKFRPTWIEKLQPERRRTRDALFGDELKRKSAKLWKKVKLGLNHNEFDVLIEVMTRENLRLEVLTQGNLELEPIRKERSRNMDTKYWTALRRYASRLYSTLLCCWPCACRVSHKASLLLDIRSNATGAVQDIKFVIVFAFQSDDTVVPGVPFPWKWWISEIKCFETPNETKLPLLSAPRPTHRRKVSFSNSTPPICSQSTSSLSLPETEKIEDLCTTLTREVSEACCLGYLDDKDWQYHVYLSDVAKQPKTPQVPLSLHQMLSPATNPPAVVIKRRDRYELALLLSSSILQLSNTPWLCDNWSKDDIHLLNSTKGTTLPKNFYVSKDFTAAHTSIEPDPELVLLRNVSVFNLGIVLLELTFGHPIEYYELDIDLRNGARTVMTNRLIAERLLRQVEEQEGKRYSDVVHRCVYCDFSTRVMSFENEEFRQNFYKGVVVPLEGILNDFIK